jgi:hypothetical protein
MALECLKTKRLDSHQAAEPVQEVSSQVAPAPAA